MTTEIMTIDPAEVELVINSTVERNTLPAFANRLQAWLASFDASALETDEDFAAAQKATTNLKSVEVKLNDIRKALITGEAHKAISELEKMCESTRQKRLELERAVEGRRKTRINEAVEAARAMLFTDLKTIKHARQVNIDSVLLEATKRKKTITSLQAALEATVNSILEAEQEYSDKFDAMCESVAVIFANEKEAVTVSEIEMLVKNFGEAAIERAKINIEGRKLEREKARIAAEQRAKLEQERIAAETEKNTIVQNAVKEEPAAVQQVEAVSSAQTTTQTNIKQPVKNTYRFGVTFEIDNPAKVVAWLERSNGKNIKFMEIK